MRGSERDDAGAAFAPDARGPGTRAPDARASDVRRLSFVAGDDTLDALLLGPPGAHALYVLAHGAGAGMEHAFMEAVAHAFATHGVATFRYNFAYAQHGRGRPDRTAVLLRAVRAAVAAAAAALPGVPLFAGGKSMGGRMTSQAHAAAPLPGVRGLVFIGFPLHPPRRPGSERAAHLAHVDLPMLFLQGTRDELAELERMRAVAAALGTRATLHVVEGADHGFHVGKRSGRSAVEVHEELAASAAAWMAAVAEAQPGV